MSHTQQVHGEDGREAIAGRGRRWYHLRPEPRRRTDLMGFNSTWWMAVRWLYGYATRRDVSARARTLFWALVGPIAFGIVAISNGRSIYAAAATRRQPRVA